MCVCVSLSSIIELSGVCVCPCDSKTSKANEWLAANDSEVCTPTRSCKPIGDNPHASKLNTGCDRLNGECIGRSVFFFRKRQVRFCGPVLVSSLCVERQGCRSRTARDVMKSEGIQ